MNENENGFPTDTNETPQSHNNTTESVNATGYPPLPHVPPSETTLNEPIRETVQTPTFAASAPCAEQPTEYCNLTQPTVSPENALLQTPLPRPEAQPAHNAFRDEPSAMSEAVRKKHFLLKGAQPLEKEEPYAYHGRRLHEERLLHDENVLGLKASATRLALLLVLYLIMQFTVLYSTQFIAGGFGLVDIQNPLHETLLSIILYVLIYPVLFPIVIYLGNLGETHKVRTFFRKPKCSPVYVFKWFITATGCTYVISIVFNIITTIIGYDNGMPTEPFTSVLDAVSQLVVLCVFAPIFEEILFRGVMLSHHVKYGAWFACIITSVFFGCFHANLQQLFYTFAGGLVMSMVVLKTGSIIPSIIIHALLNFTSFLQLLSLSLIDNAEAYLNGTDLLPKGHPLALVFVAFTTILPWIFMIAAIIMLIVELIKNRSTFRMPRGDSGLAAKEKAAAFFTTPAVWVAIVVTALAITFNEVMMYLSNNLPQ